MAGVSPDRSNDLRRGELHPGGPVRRAPGPGAAMVGLDGVVLSELREFQLLERLHLPVALGGGPAPGSAFRFGIGGLPPAGTGWRANPPAPR